MEVQCDKRDLGGVWKNSAGSSMCLVCVGDDDTAEIAGFYTSAWPSTEGVVMEPTPLAGLVKYAGEGGDNLISWSVLWKGGKSMTIWVGQCMMDEEGRTQMIFATWLLRTLEPDRSHFVNQDTFWKVSPHFPKTPHYEPIGLNEGLRGRWNSLSGDAFTIEFAHQYGNVTGMYLKEYEVGDDPRELVGRTDCDKDFVAVAFSTTGPRNVKAWAGFVRSPQEGFMESAWLSHTYSPKLQAPRRFVSFGMDNYQLLQQPHQETKEVLAEHDLRGLWESSQGSSMSIAWGESAYKIVGSFCANAKTSHLNGLVKPVEGASLVSWSVLEENCVTTWVGQCMSQGGSRIIFATRLQRQLTPNLDDRWRSTTIHQDTFFKVLKPRTCAAGCCDSAASEQASVGMNEGIVGRWDSMSGDAFRIEFAATTGKVEGQHLTPEVVGSSPRSLVGLTQVGPDFVSIALSTEGDGMVKAWAGFICNNPPGGQGPLDCPLLDTVWVAHGFSPKLEAPRSCVHFGADTYKLLSTGDEQAQQKQKMDE